MKIVLRFAFSIIALGLLAGVLQHFYHVVDHNMPASLFGEESRPTTAEAISSELKEKLGESAYSQRYQDCVKGQIEKRLQGKLRIVEQWNQLHGVQRKEAIYDFLAQIGPPCEFPGQQIINPNASDAQFNFTRRQLAATLDITLRRAGIVQAKRECVVQGIEGMPDAELTEMLNGSQEIGKDILDALYESCA
jgi:hypothetical protein